MPFSFGDFSLPHAEGNGQTYGTHLIALCWPETKFVSVFIWRELRQNRDRTHWQRIIKGIIESHWSGSGAPHLTCIVTTLTGYAPLHVTTGNLIRRHHGAGVAVSTMGKRVEARNVCHFLTGDLLLKGGSGFRYRGGVSEFTQEAKALRRICCSNL